MNVDEEQVKNDWLESEGQFQIKTIAQFYGVFEHLFGLAYFLPRIQLDIKVKQLKFSKKIVNSHKICSIQTVCRIRGWVCTGLLWKHTKADTCKESTRSYIRCKEEIDKQWRTFEKSINVFIFVQFSSINLQIFEKCLGGRRIIMDISSNQSRWTFHWKW